MLYPIRLILAINHLSHIFVYLVVKPILSFLSPRGQNLALSLCSTHILVIFLGGRPISPFITPPVNFLSSRIFVLIRRVKYKHTRVVINLFPSNSNTHKRKNLVSEIKDGNDKKVQNKKTSKLKKQTLGPVQASVDNETARITSLEQDSAFYSNAMAYPDIILEESSN